MYMDNKLTEKEQQQKEEFNSASPVDKLRVINTVNDQLFQITNAKLASFPLISSVAAALLILASFNDIFLSIHVLFIVKILISVLLLIIPISLILYARFINNAEKKGVRLMTKIYQVPLSTKTTCIDELTLRWSWIVSVLILVVIIIIIFLMWFQ